MPRKTYLTAPPPLTGMPPGVPYIIGNEAAERFSFYGMKAILIIFMTQYLRGSDGQLDVMGEENAKAWYHAFTSAVYFLPIIGALLSDGLLGKYRTIISLSLVYCLGHAALAADDTRLGLFAGLALISIGSGGIKPCVSANVGDQFGRTNAALMPRVFGWFYFSINFGSFFSTLLIPWLLDRFGPNVAFAIPGVLMGVATLAFWMGRWKFVHVPPGGAAFLREAFSSEGLRALVRLSVIFAFVAPFWAIFDQSGSAWVLQAEKMDRHFLGYEWLSSQIQAANPALIMVLIPLFSYVIYPAINRVFRLTAMRKICIGLFVGTASFALVALVEQWITAGARPSIGWQLLAYVILTAAEVMVSITCLEFAYTQAPRKMKSLIMSLYLMSMSLGNGFTALVNYFIQKPDGTTYLPGASYYWFFTVIMLATSAIFVLLTALYREKTYIQEEAPEQGFPVVTDETA